MDTVFSKDDWKDRIACDHNKNMGFMLLEEWKNICKSFLGSFTVSK